jgi:hypothetical protein
LAAHEIAGRLAGQVLPALTLLDGVDLDVLGCVAELERAARVPRLAAGLAAGLRAQALGFGRFGPVGRGRARTDGLRGAVAQPARPASPALARYTEVARLLTGSERASAHDGVAWARRLFAALRLAPLRAYGLTLEAVPVLCEKAAASSSSMKGNPITLDTAELHEILVRAR